MKILIFAFLVSFNYCSAQMAFNVGGVKYYAADSKYSVSTADIDSIGVNKTKDTILVYKKQPLNNYYGVAVYNAGDRDEITQIFFMKARGNKEAEKLFNKLLKDNYGSGGFKKQHQFPVKRIYETTWQILKSN